MRNVGSNHVMCAKQVFALVAMISLGTHSYGQESQVQETSGYEGRFKLPLDLRTPDGALIDKGLVSVEVRREEGGHVLRFLRNDKMLATIRGFAAADQSEITIPIVGTIFLRSKNSPIGTEEERHFSKTGRPQYAEETRDWKATLEVYRHRESEDAGIRLLFQERGANYGEWTNVDFLLHINQDPREVSSGIP